MINITDELYLELQDTEWPFEYKDHDRSIARAIVFETLSEPAFTK